MNTRSTKYLNYLEACNDVVVAPALSNGLDTECYYRYLSETERVVPCKDELIEKIKGLLFDEWNDSAEGAQFQLNFANTFKRQREFILALVDFIENHYSEDVKELVRAQVDFMRMTLHAQRRYLDTVTYWTPFRLLMSTNGGDEYAEAQVEHEKLTTIVWMAIRKYEL